MALLAPACSHTYCDRASWARPVESMDMLRCFDHRKIVYEVIEQKQPYRSWLLLWKGWMNDVKQRVVMEQATAERRAKTCAGVGGWVEDEAY